MFLSVKEMEVRKVRFDVTFPVGRLDFSAEELVQAGPLQAAGTAELLENSGGDFRVVGRYTVEMASQCDRCLGRARFALDAALDLFYQPAKVIAVDEEVAIDQNEAEIGFYNGDGIELEEILHEQILLSLPMQRVCSEDCRGICPECGVNRNEVSCGCAEKESDPRWTALRHLAKEL
jgi:uncharacterized protein